MDRKVEALTDEDLEGIEKLMTQRSHVLLPQEDWSRVTLLAMLDKVPVLLEEVRRLRKEREILKLTLEMDLDRIALEAMHRTFEQTKTLIVRKIKADR